MQRLQLVVLDDYEGQMATAPAMARLQELAEVVVLKRPLTPADHPLLSQTHVLFAIRERTRLDADFFAACPNLRLVLQSGGHAYHLDKAAATERGIVVALGRQIKMPTVAIPELTFGLILSLKRQIHALNAQMAQGAWPTTPMGSSLAGKTLGILGYGRHGRPVARVAQAFGMKVVAWDRSGKSAPSDDGVQRLPLPDTLACADVVSIHLRLSPESTGLIGAAELAQMRSDALLINTARGAIVDEAALVQALQTHTIAGAGLDVFAVEPLPADSPLRTLPNVVLTPHIGWKTTEIFHEFAAKAAEQLEAWINGRLSPSDMLNPPV